MKQKIMRRNLCQGKGKGGKGTQGRKGNKGRGEKEIGQERYRCVLGLFRHRNASICLGLSLDPNKTDSSAACDCWSSPGLSLMAATVRTCKIKDHSGAITAALRNCTKAFQKCRKYEDAAHTALSSCVSDTTKMTKKAASLAANEAAMTAAKEKMNSLAGLTRQSGRQASSCLEIISFSQKSNILSKKSKNILFITLNI